MTHVHDKKEGNPYLSGLMDVLVGSGLNPISSGHDINDAAQISVDTLKLYYHADRLSNAGLVKASCRTLAINAAKNIYKLEALLGNSTESKRLSVKETLRSKIYLFFNPDERQRLEECKESLTNFGTQLSALEREIQANH